MDENDIPRVLRNQVPYRELYFYQKSEVIYAMTYYFAHKYYVARKDRTVDQIIQAARSGKQNIVEGFADGVMSTELQLKLINVARSSLEEVRADYEDYILTRNLSLWDAAHPRYEEMLNYCRSRNRVDDYKRYFEKWDAEEFCNVALTLLHMTDKMMISYLKGLETQFITQGGIRERMYAARTGYRQNIDNELQALRDQVKSLRQQLSVKEQEINRLLAENHHLEVLLTQSRHPGAQ